MHAVDHVLDELLLGAAKSAPVRNVEHAVVRLSVLTVDTSDLNVVLVSDRVELVLSVHQLRQLDVHGAAHRSAQVRRAAGDVTIVVVVRELANGLNVLGSAAKAIEDLLDTSTLLHGDDAQLVLLVDPDEERLRVIVEDASAGRPVAVEVAGFEEPVALLEQEVVVDQLLLSGLVHAFERVERALQVTFEGLAGLDDLVHGLEALLLGDTRAQRVAVEVSADADASGIDHGGIFRREFSVLEVGAHVRYMLVRRLVAVVLLDDRVEQLGELGVRVVRAGVDTDSGIEVLDSRENASLEGNAGSIDLIFVLFPDFLRHSLAECGLCARREESFIVLELLCTVELHWLELLVGLRLGRFLLRGSIVLRWCHLLLLHRGALGSGLSDHFDGAGRLELADVLATVESFDHFCALQSKSLTVRPAARQ